MCVRLSVCMCVQLCESMYICMFVRMVKHVELELLVVKTTHDCSYVLQIRKPVDPQIRIETCVCKFPFTQ